MEVANKFSDMVTYFIPLFDNGVVTISDSPVQLLIIVSYSRLINPRKIRSSSLQIYPFLPKTSAGKA